MIIFVLFISATAKLDATFAFTNISFAADSYKPELVNSTPKHLYSWTISIIPFLKENLVLSGGPPF